MKNLIASLLCALTLSTLPGCFTAAGAVVGHEVQQSRQKRGEDSSAFAAGTAIGLALDVTAVVLVASAISSAVDSIPPLDINPYQPGGD
jgi:hypothetical protein